MNVIFLGPPGSGKGTMAQKVAQTLGVAHISTGDMLREQIKQGTELGKYAKSFIDAGKLVPDDVIIDMMQQRVKQDDAKAGILLDGFPRTVQQAEALDNSGINIDHVINLVVEQEVIVQRVLSRRVCDKCGAVFNIKTYSSEDCNVCDGGKLMCRADDNEETVRGRFSVYEEQTAPLIAYYSAKGVLKDVDATQPIEQEAAEILSILGAK